MISSGFCYAKITRRLIVSNHQLEEEHGEASHEEQMGQIAQEGTFCNA